MRRCFHGSAKTTESIYFLPRPRWSLVFLQHPNLPLTASIICSCVPMCTRLNQDGPPPPNLPSHDTRVHQPRLRCQGYTAFGLEISRKSSDCGWNLANVATGIETLSTWMRPPSSSNRFRIICRDKENRSDNTHTHTHTHTHKRDALDLDEPALVQ